MLHVVISKFIFNLIFSVPMCFIYIYNIYILITNNIYIFTLIYIYIYIILHIEL